MASLSDALDITTRKDMGRNLVFPIANGETVYVGGYYCINAAGYLTEQANTEGNVPAGILIGYDAGATNAGGAQPLAVAGDTSATPVPTGIVDVGEKLINDVPIATLSAQLDIITPIYLGTDNWASDITGTPTTWLPPIGWAVKRNSATSFEVFLSSMASMRRALPKRRYWELTLDTGANEGQASANVAQFRVPYEAVIVGSSWRPGAFDSGYTSGSQTLTIRNGTTGNVSGGVTTVAYTALNGASDLDAWVSGTAVTNTSGNARVARGAILRLVRSAASGINAITAPVPYTVYIEHVELPSQ